MCCHIQEVAAAARLVLPPDWAERSRHARWAAALSAATPPEVCPVVLFDCASMMQLLGLNVRCIGWSYASLCSMAAYTLFLERLESEALICHHVIGRAMCAAAATVAGGARGCSGSAHRHGS
jgi:hypothetical protein